MRYSALFLLSFLGVCNAQCNYPPDSWCESPEVATKCGAEKACQEFQSAQKLKKKIKVTVLYEALCDGCAEYITGYFFPVWNNSYHKIMKEITEVELVPWGNVMNGYCQHGPVECAYNKLDSCIMAVLNITELWFPVIFHVERYLVNRSQNDVLLLVSKEFQQNLPIRNWSFPSDKADLKKHIAMFNLTGLTADKVVDCYYGQMGTDLQEKAKQRTAGVAPKKHIWVPWLLYDDVSSYHMQNLTDAPVGVPVCYLYRGPGKFPNCYGIDVDNPWNALGMGPKEKIGKINRCYKN